MSRLAALLRRLAARIDPTDPQPPASPAQAQKRRYEEGPISRVREIQEERIRELEYLIDRNREHDPGTGLAWLEGWQLAALADLLQHELDLRDDQLERLLGGRSG